MQIRFKDKSVSSSTVSAASPFLSSPCLLLQEEKVAAAAAATEKMSQKFVNLRHLHNDEKWHMTVESILMHTHGKRGREETW